MDRESTFELNKPGHYEVDFVQETGFDPDQYGNVWYSVKFAGDAEAHMWLAKNKPETGAKYYGHFEMTKSGKKLRFRVDKEPDPQPHKSSWQPKNEGQVTLNMVWKNLLNTVGVPQSVDDKLKFWQMVKEHADELLALGENIHHE